MGAGVIEGVERTADVRHGDLGVQHLEGPHASLCELMVSGQSGGTEEPLTSKWKNSVCPMCANRSFIADCEASSGRTSTRNLCPPIPRGRRTLWPMGARLGSIRS